jgi:hypothetical protein
MTNKDTLRDELEEVCESYEDEMKDWEIEDVLVDLKNKYQ